MPTNTPSTKAKPPVKVEATETKAPADIQRYYRIKKITGYLAEILEVEIDESIVKPKAVSKQDSWHLLLDKITQLVYPGPDAIAKRKREEEAAAAAVKLASEKDKK